MTDQEHAYAPDAQPGAAAAVAAGCTCPTWQPSKDRRSFTADKDCPLHGLGMLAAELGVELPESDLIKRAREAALERQQRAAKENARRNEGRRRRFAADLRLFFGVDVEENDVVTNDDGYVLTTIDEITFRRGSMQSTDYVQVDSPTGRARVSDLAGLFIAMTLLPKKVEPEPEPEPEPDRVPGDLLDDLVDVLDDLGFLQRCAARIR